MIAEYVGVLRAVSGNLPHIQQRLVSYRKALGTILFSGIARPHRGNPLALLGVPTLFSRLGTIIINGAETDIINQHVKETVQNLLQFNSSHFATLCYLLTSHQIKNPSSPNLDTHTLADYWQYLRNKMRNEDDEMSSLKYFQPKFMSLLRPHPILKTAGHSYDTNKMIIKLRMLRGRYRVGAFLKHISSGHM
jgi:hypothetical protein